ncbi:hypothetical protein JN11_02737 [Mucilaginibacter frigoritolerans]|uniref:Uncharacterized protein n=1 Tax=Mucilaginibacter frigoritolerans TaxID=652788 RepID=A0A562U2T1_9SPHI|nr:hypothetical protein [Mucilaginibacter frigoritolerans]TWI99420.1 hypothetical protein JN11_02737 [Mucilaginibacter frigoritolerans]
MRYFFVLLFLICNAVNAATVKSSFFADTDKQAHLTADTDTVFKKRSVSVGVNYGSDIQFFGRTGPIKYPFMSADAIYNTKTGFFLYTAIYKVLGYNPLVDEVDVGAGYLFNYSKKFSGTISYTRFIFNKDAAAVIKSASSNDINLKNTFDWKFAKSSITGDYLFGDANDYFITFSTSKYFETSWSIFDDKDYLSFNPTISAIFGTQNFVQRYSVDNPDKLSLEELPPPTFDGDKSPHYDNGRFNALNYSVKLPIAYNRPHYTFEASWKYSIPVNVEGALKNRHEVFFNLTFFYLFY